MQKEMWRLYRHLIIGCLIILVGCYAAIEFAMFRVAEAKHEQVLCVDAELSVALLSMAGKNAVPESQFRWQVLDRPKGLAQTQALLAQKKWQRLSNGDYQLAFGTDAGASFVGVAAADSKRFHLEALLKGLLLSPLSYADKLSLLQSISCLSVDPVSSEMTSSVEGVTLTYGVHNKHGFLWTGHADSDEYYISIDHIGPLSLTFTVVAIVAIAIIAMLALIWRELFYLDLKRKNFENLTRQIARGRSGLPKEIPDSNGTLKELAYSFDSMSSHIQRLLKVQREMINAISHELRTPIARLRFGLEVIKDDADQSMFDTVTALEGDVEELNTLVDEVLTYGKLEEGSLALNFQETSVKQLLGSILENNEPLLKHLEVVIDVPDNDEVVADEHHLHRALQNLILNASKYANSKIAIVFSSDDERWQLDIEDDGPGIAIEDRDKVFIPFQRLDNSRTRASGGYGLGLAIVQRIAFWHGGAVLVDASELGGAKFSLIWSRNQHQKSVS
ncbi:ATP-binding protein [Marinomonas pollencensis]|uniref:histidine kinase n=1 Tax=Marinomonas pollencensis TaxID=491954 RepID=A0A3E0DLL7_9GAMM|nr:ATP-binding protein [Marinomonas pollencensis]REG82984.1 two-component system sensor histidine kinase RstB [Marinomonas pollencensis]